MSREYRLAPGTLTKSALNANPAYLLEFFPLQADQGGIYFHPWGPPIDEGTTYPANAEYVETLAETQEAEGPVEFDWVLAYLTEGMVAYMNTTFFASASWSLCTVKTLGEDGQFYVYNANVWKPRPNRDHQRSDRGVERYTLRFRAGVLLP